MARYTRKRGGSRRTSSYSNARRTYTRRRVSRSGVRRRSQPRQQTVRLVIENVQGGGGVPLTNGGVFASTAPAKKATF